MQIRNYVKQNERGGPIEDELHAKGQPAKIISLDGKEVIDAIEIKKGVLFFENYKKTSNPELLKKACEKGCFKALIVRSNNFKTIIMSASSAEENKNAAADALLNDLDRLGNLYWSVGNIHASRVLLKLGDFFSQKNDAAKAELYWEKSASMFYIAKLLLHVDMSDNMRDIIYQGRDYTACGYKSLEEAENTTTSHIALEDKNRIFTIAQNRVKDLVEHHPHRPQSFSGSIWSADHE